jgi:hypothetical protein
VTELEVELLASVYKASHQEQEITRLKSKRKDGVVEFTNLKNEIEEFKSELTTDENDIIAHLKDKLNGLKAELVSGNKK